MPEDLQQEFDVLARRAGLAIPADRRAPLLEAYGDLRRMLDVLRQPRTAASEPASTYDIRTVTRAIPGGL